MSLGATISVVTLNLPIMAEVDSRNKSSIDPFAAFYKAVQTYGSFLPDVS